MRHERDYIERTIATVRNHRDADNCWPQWANIFADEIEDGWARVRELEAALTDALVVFADTKWAETYAALAVSPEERGAKLDELLRLGEETGEYPAAGGAEGDTR